MVFSPCSICFTPILDRRPHILFQHFALNIKYSSCSPLAPPLLRIPCLGCCQRRYAR
jgi:hypothetical protein